ncbi:MAG TPA: GMC oxidoreductase [Amycolatopsis sp.]|uniref:GMC family oxidoreductase n=1 Tax=Amycolatopsis sp. TaxID=37632 RepID=UPI002B4A7C0B|nr:GMC oxidoreductase [Amycolatopsis sp.]HKS46322.1 GMC oxidoreductase [Amycolatopsis sp.]
MNAEFDYVVIGSGAGGGPVAARLAEAGFEVLLLEAGGREGGPIYEVPAFHAFATEDPDLRWDFYVRHWTDDERQWRDSKYVARQDGVWYPRASSLGGCTANNAMITLCPHDQDWDDIAALTGDSSWNATRMRWWFQLLERCSYVRRPRWLPKNPGLAAVLERLPLPGRLVNRSRHGFDGWLSTSLADPEQALRDPRLVRLVLAAAKDTLAEALGRPLTAFEGLGTHPDPNDWRTGGAACEGLWRIPLATAHGRRSGTRELVERAETLFPNRLTVRTGCLVTRILFESGTTTVRGVEFVDERHASTADPRAPLPVWPPATERVEVRGEVVLAAGAFNTPQLLMLSGIGPRRELERHGIDVRVDRPGVGANLQDRYEAGVVYELNQDFAALEDTTFTPPRYPDQYDRRLADWSAGCGVYTTTGAAIGLSAKSRPKLAVPDLFLLGLPANFRGYYPGFAAELERNRRYFTWSVLKAHTANRAGRVELRSVDARVPPMISFRYFEEGDDSRGDDLDAVVRGIELAREIMRRARLVVRKEIVPGAAVEGTGELRDFVRDEAWGQHACGTARIGVPDDPGAVVDSRFRVIGTDCLRVVDASVFPRIPGFFLATGVSMVAEKAAAAIVDDAHRFA